MKKVKKIFPSRNYITIDCFGDIEIIFNPVNDGFEGDDKLLFRRGRWAFRVNDFLSGKVLNNGEQESMNRKIYSLNCVYDDTDGEPIINTTYVDPTSVIPLDGSVVSVNGLPNNLPSLIQSRSSEASLRNLQAVVANIITYFHDRSLLNFDLGTNYHYPAGTVIKFKDLNHWVTLNVPSVTLAGGNGFLMLGDFTEYDKGTVKRLNALTFSLDDVEKIQG